MLLRFGAQNHLSLRDHQQISLIASSLTDQEEGLIDCPPAGSSVLPAAVIYGANASGKSNVIDSLRFMRAAVLWSHSRGKPDGGVPRHPFALDPAAASALSKYDIDFVVEGVRYHYGFECSDESFLAEWLFTFPKNRRQILFEREGQTFSFGRKLKGRNAVISDLTRSNSLFLSCSAQNDHETLTKIANFFRSIRSSRSLYVSGSGASRQFGEGELDERVIAFLRKANTGVVGYRKKEEAVSSRSMELSKELGTLIKKFVPDFDESDFPTAQKTWELELSHLSSAGDPVYFDLEKESSGTRRLLVLLRSVFRSLDIGTPLVIDELDSSLHTQACEAIIALFSLPTTNPNGAQLIATTHDTNLLRSPLLRRDQVWFTEKDEGGATHVFPLTDIRTRKNDNIEKGYLQGRFGAIPFSGPVEEILGAKG